MQHEIQVISTDASFAENVVKIANELLWKCFSAGISEETVEAMNFCHAVWMASADTTVAFAAIAKVDSTVFKLHAVCVDFDFRKEGRATAMVKKCESFVPSGCTLCLCVDNYEDSTLKLCEWYTSLGFEREDTSFEPCDEDMEEEIVEIKFFKLIE